MIVGNQSTFAIESGITQAFSRLSFRALGFFVIHLGGRSYGVHSPDATMLSNSFDEVQNRIARQGSHIATFAAEPDAGIIADAFRDAIYSPKQTGRLFLGLPQSQLCRLIHSNHLIWAPDGGAAFDDGSYVLHFDAGESVRLIAYQLEPWGEDFHHNPHTLSDQWVDANEFYQTLKQWRDAFNADWLASPKK